MESHTRQKSAHISNQLTSLKCFLTVNEKNVVYRTRSIKTNTPILLHSAKTNNDSYPWRNKMKELCKQFPVKHWDLIKNMGKNLLVWFKNTNPSDKFETVSYFRDKNFSIRLNFGVLRKFVQTKGSSLF